MNQCVLAFALTLACAAGANEGHAAGTAVAPLPPAVAEDAWLAEDKLRHFTLSFAATQLAYGGARVLLQPDAATAAAATAAFGLGIAKEIRDRRRGGPFSWRDLVWDAAGVLLGVALVRQIR